MGTSDCISLISAILIGSGTLALAFMTWRSIRQTRSIRRAEKEERLLNEIIEWATDLNRCAWEHEYTESGGQYSKEYAILREANALFRFRAADAKSEYVRSIASIFGEALYSSVEQSKKHLDDYLRLRWKSISSREKEEKQKLRKKIQKSEAKLYKSVDVLAKEAAKLKTRDIS